MTNDKLKKAKNFITSSNTEEALKILRDLDLSNSNRRVFDSLRIRWNDLMNENRAGIVDESNYNTRKNKINHDLLGFISNLDDLLKNDDKQSKSEGPNNSTWKLKNHLRPALLGLLLLFGIYIYFSGLTVTSFSTKVTYFLTALSATIIFEGAISVLFKSYKKKGVIKSVILSTTILLVILGVASFPINDNKNIVESIIAGNENLIQTKNYSEELSNVMLNQINSSKDVSDILKRFNLLMKIQFKNKNTFFINYFKSHLDYLSRQDYSDFMIKFFNEHYDDSSLYLDNLLQTHKDSRTEFKYEKFPKSELEIVIKRSIREKNSFLLTTEDSDELNNKIKSIVDKVDIVLKNEIEQLNDSTIIKLNTNKVVDFVFTFYSQKEITMSSNPNTYNIVKDVILDTEFDLDTRFKAIKLLGRYNKDEDLIFLIRLLANEKDEIIRNFLIRGIDNFLCIRSKRNNPDSKCIEYLEELR